MRVYKWPDGLGVVGAEWTVEDPVSRSASLLTNRVLMSAAQRRRRLAVLNVQAAYGDGGGYVEAFKRLLRGGLHAVRLHSFPLNVGEECGSIITTQAQEIAWTTGADDLAWTHGGNPLRWFTGAYSNATPYTLVVETAQSGVGVAQVTGLTPGQVMARVGTFVTVFNADGTSSETRMLLRPVVASSFGGAKIYTDEPFTASGSVEFGTRDTGVFLPDAMPRAIRPLEDAWQVGWSFREVFADEIAPDTFAEVDPWG